MTLKTERIFAISLSIIIPFVMACGLVTWAQTPRQSLDPKLYRQITGDSPDYTSAINGLSSRFETVEAQHSYMISQQQVILEQLKQVPEIRLQQAINAARLDAITESLAAEQLRLKEHMGDTSRNPTSIALLESKVEEIRKAATWILCGVGTLFLSFLASMVKRLYAMRRDGRL